MLRVSKNLFAVIIALFVLIHPGQSTGTEMNDAEEWIFRQLKAGMIADLADYGHPDFRVEEFAGEYTIKQLTDALIKSKIINEGEQCDTVKDVNKLLKRSDLYEKIIAADNHLNLEKLIKERKTIYNKTKKEDDLKIINRIALEMFLPEQTPKRHEEISPSFIRRLILNAELRKQLPSSGIRIRHAQFSSYVNLADLVVDGNLWLEDCIFKETVNLSGSNVSKRLSFTGSSFSKDLELSESDIGQNLDLNGVTGHNIFLSEASIKKQCTIVDSDIQSVNLYNANIGLTLHLNRSRFIDGLSLENFHITKDLIIRGVETKSIIIHDSIIEGDLVLGSAYKALGKYAGDFETGDVWRRRYSDTRDIQWENNKSELDLSGTKIGNLLVSRNLLASKDVCPRIVKLVGFEYANFMLLIIKDEKEERTGLDISSDDLIHLLKKNTFLSLQPYEQLATELEKQGYKQKAKDIRFAARKEEHHNSSGLACLWGWILRGTVGYGLKPYYAVIWTILFIIGGSFVFRKEPAVVECGSKYGLIYSFDMLLPIIKLREKHYEIDITSRARYYLYFHKLVGYALGMFIVAAITDLIK